MLTELYTQSSQEQLESQGKENVYQSCSKQSFYKALSSKDETKIQVGSAVVTSEVYFWGLNKNKMFHKSKQVISKPHLLSCLKSIDVREVSCGPT